ncbi:hypothetical protein D3C76_1313120 [compost metagenome]
MLPRRVTITGLILPLRPLKAPRNTPLKAVPSARPKNFSDSRRTPVVVKLASCFSMPWSISTGISIPPGRCSSILRVSLGRVRLGTSPWKLMPSTNRFRLARVSGIIAM